MRRHPKLGYFLWGFVFGMAVGFGIVACSAKPWTHLQVEEIDGHEYVFSYEGGLVHKANCKGERVEK